MTGAWFLGLTLRGGAGEETTDEWQVLSEADARAEFAKAKDREDLYCACIGPICEGTEPHWTEPGAI